LPSGLDLPEKADSYFIRPNGHILEARLSLAAFNQCHDLLNNAAANFQA